MLVHGDRDPSVAGIIDFGDMVHTYAVCELANALAYLVIDAGDPARIVEIVAGAYDRVNPLSNAEADALYDFLALRLCLSVTMAARQRGQDPGNAYLGVTENAAWAYLENAPARGRVSPGADFRECRVRVSGRTARQNIPWSSCSMLVLSPRCA